MFRDSCYHLNIHRDVFSVSAALIQMCGVIFLPYFALSGKKIKKTINLLKSTFMANIDACKCLAYCLQPDSSVASVGFSTRLPAQSMLSGWE